MVYSVYHGRVGMKRLAISAVVTLLVWVLAIAGLLVFGTAKPPPVLPSITEPFSSLDYRGLPPLQSFQARDGAQLHFREYPASGGQVAVLIHGSAGSSSDMHLLALALQSAGVASYVPDLRGHGADEPHGDIAYVGQLDDDLADFMARTKAMRRSATWTLIGFSSGGGFALRVAAEMPLGQMFDRFVLLAPFLRYDAPSIRTAGFEKTSNSGAVPVAAHSWAAASIGRIIGLTILDFIGIHAWDGLPVVAFAVPANVASVTQHYSWRLQQNFGAHDNYRADIRAVTRPMQVYVGADDELLIAEKLANEFESRQDIQVSVLPGIGHSGLITRPDAIRAVVAEFQR
jgi:pimeloyl-ACP methyl ester carboxylesterase